jgi:hypothetical protein
VESAGRVETMTPPKIGQTYTVLTTDSRKITRTPMNLEHEIREYCWRRKFEASGRRTRGSDLWWRVRGWWHRSIIVGTTVRTQKCRCQSIGLT